MTYHQRPVVALWGLGFGDSPSTRPTSARALQAVNDIKGQGFAVLGGVPFHFRTNDGDASADSKWQKVYAALDIVSPWSVGRKISTKQQTILINMRERLATLSPQSWQHDFLF